MTRRRTTDRKASAPPATPGYAEGTNHPAWPGPDPDADKYMNGDPSSWAEDPHPGPYPNTPAPADPGMQEPQGHPATDPAHYFPSGSKAASRQLRAAMTQKAAKCIRIATSMLPKNASVDAIEDQALDLMSLGDRQIAAALARLGGKDANYTLTPERSADDLLADDMIVDDEDVVVPASKKAEEEEEESKKEAKKADDEDGDEDDAEVAAKKAAKYARLAAHFAKKAKKAAEEEEEETEKEAKKADEDEETEKEAKKASGRRAAPSGNQNDPAHYNYEGSDLGKNKKASEDEDEDEALLAEMMEEESKKASAAKSAKKDEPFGGKKAPPFEKKDDSEKKEAKKADDDEETASDDDEAKKEAKKADDDAEEEKKSEDEAEGEEKKANVNDMLSGMDEDPMMDDVFGEDPMALMDPSEMGGLSENEMAAVYGGRYAGKKKADDEAEEKKSDEDEAKKEAKKAAVKPQPRVASTGPRTLGSVPSNSRTASAEIADLSKLWETSPDVSKVFGG